MPLGFPSHQGLLAPLWRRWPAGIGVLGLWIGAIVPDLVDGTENLLVLGRFQQWIGHSLLGATVLGVPVGLALTALLRRGARQLAAPAATQTRRWWRAAAAYLVAIDHQRGARVPDLCRDALAVWIGALSHVFFDLLSHEHSRLCWPFEDPDWFGAWWRTAWIRVSAPGYPDYPIGPHFVGWLLLSGLGIWMFCRWRPRP